MAAWKKICCPVDFTWESRVAMQEAAEIAWRLGSRLTLVHVLARGVAPVPDAEPDAVQRKLDEWLQDANRIAANGVDSAVLTGSPAEEIVRFAREGRYDVVVMGTRAAEGVEHWNVGSVAQAVVGRAPCTVVVVRGRGYRDAGHAAGTP